MFRQSTIVTLFSVSRHFYLQKQIFISLLVWLVWLTCGPGMPWHECARFFSCVGAGCLVLEGKQAKEEICKEATSIWMYLVILNSLDS